MKELTGELPDLWAAPGRLGLQTYFWVGNYLLILLYLHFGSTGFSGFWQMKKVEKFWTSGHCTTGTILLYKGHKSQPTRRTSCVHVLFHTFRLVRCIPPLLCEFYRCSKGEWFFPGRMEVLTVTTSTKFLNFCIKYIYKFWVHTGHWSEGKYPPLLSNESPSAQLWLMSNWEKYFYGEFIRRENVCMCVYDSSYVKLWVCRELFHPIDCQFLSIRCGVSFCGKQFILGGIVP